MRVLYLAQRVPYPPNRGDKIATFYAVRHLGGRHEVQVAALADGPEEEKHAEGLRALGVEVTTARHGSTQARLGALAALPRGLPLSVGYYGSRALSRTVRDVARRAPPDVVIAFSSSMAQYAELVPRAPLIADFVDMDSRKWELYAQFGPRLKRWIYRLEARRLLAWEGRVARRARCALLRTEAERQDCARLIPGSRFEVLSNGVDLEYFRPSEAPPEGSDLVFTGVMDYFPNEHGVAYFAREVFPRVRARVPSATFTIVGAKPTPAVWALGAIPGVRVTGSVPDVRPYLARARVSVAPLILARGIQNKILEAMAMALPVVATPTAFRGVDAAPGEGVEPADGPAEFAQKVAALLEDPGRAAALGRRGRELVERRYVWPEQMAKLDRLLEEIGEAPR